MVFLNSVKGWKQIGTAAVITNGHVAIQTQPRSQALAAQPGEPGNEANPDLPLYTTSDKRVAEEWEHCEQYSAHNENPARNDYTTYMYSMQAQSRAQDLLF